MQNMIERFNSVNALKTNIEKEIEGTEIIIQEYSNLLGKKIRTNEESSMDDPEFLELKAKLDGDSSNSKSKDDEKQKKESKDKKSKTKKTSDKKKKSKKGVDDKWYNLNEILIYNGMGLKGELELYFKAIDELKSKLENLQRTLSTLNNIIEKGLKADMGCVVFRGTEGILEITFLKSTGIRGNFSLKAIYTGAAIPVKNIIKMGE